MNEINWPFVALTFIKPLKTSLYRVSFSLVVRKLLKSQIKLLDMTSLTTFQLAKPTIRLKSNIIENIIKTIINLCFGKSWSKKVTLLNTKIYNTPQKIFSLELHESVCYRELISLKNISPETSQDQSFTKLCEKHQHAIPCQRPFISTQTSKPSITFLTCWYQKQLNLGLSFEIKFLQMSSQIFELKIWKKHRSILPCHCKCFREE